MTVYRLRCTVSGGLEGFAEAEFSPLLSNKGGGVALAWHHKGHTGSLLDLLCDQSREVFLQETISWVLHSLRFVDNVSLQVLSVETSESMNADWITEQCLQQNKETLDTAVEAWALWKPPLERAMSANELEGELIAMPIATNSSIEVPPAIQTETFQVNTIYTKPPVAKMAVDKFVQLVQKDLPSKDQILWLDAGAGAGSLLQQLPSDASIGVDLDPRHPSVHKKDFFEVSTEWLQSLHPDYKTLCLISNPPFVQGSRGDYTIIAKFLEHVIRLQAVRFGLIVPQKFAHVWKSFGLPIQLRYRMHLPHSSFYDPSTSESKHVKCYLLIFDLQPSTISNDQPTTPPVSNDTPPTIHVVAQRDKGLYPDISTAEVTAAVVHGLGRSGVPLGSSKTSELTLRAKLGTRLELFLDLNPKRPLSIANSISSQVEGHSLGWMSKSVKPPVARAMNYLGQFGRVASAATSPNREDVSEENQPNVTVNLLCGEGTLEFEATDHSTSCFRIVGDKSPDALNRVKSQMSTLSDTKAPPMDFVVWDAQNLPLRSGIADAVLADLPFAGSNKKKHQQPSTDNTSTNPSFSYPKVMASTVRVLAPVTGRAVLVSADAKAMTHGIWKFAGHLKETWQTKLNIGGLQGRISLVVRKCACWKDLNLIVEDANADHSSEVLARARETCSGFAFDELLELQEMNASTEQSLVCGVEHRNIYRREDQTVCHCYRIHFDPLVTNTQAKSLEKEIRRKLEGTPIDGARLE